MKRTGFLAVVIVLMIIASPLFSQMGNYSLIENEPVTRSIEENIPIENTVHSSSYELHDRISISDDLDWVEQNIPGSGTEEDPYVIENLEIKSNIECIFIVYTSKHYVVRNCLLWSDSSQGEGITINHADHGLVENCTIIKKSYGIFVMNTNGLVIRNNSMYNLGRHGVRLSTASNCNVSQNVIRDTLDNGIYCQSSNCRIENNTIWNSSEEAIYMFQCSNSIVLSNSLSNSSAGSYLESCDSITFANNTMFNNDDLGFRNYDSDNCIFSNNSIYDTDGYGVMWNRGDDSSITGNNIGNSSLYGFYLYYSRNCNLSSNSFENDGLVITGSNLLDWKHNINDNTANGKVLGYFYNSTDVLLDGSIFGQVIVVSCTALNIQGGVMSQTDMGIAFYYSENCTVNSTSISDQMIGIYLYGSKSCNITHSIMVNCGILINGGALSQWIHNFTGTTVNGKPVGYFFEETGHTLDDNSLGQIIVVNSTNITIKNYAISKASQSLTFAYSSECNVIESNLSDNYIGARLYDCSNVIFENDTILNTINSGVLVYYSNNCTFRNVTILEASYGIYISDSSECSINESTLSHNEYGVYLRSSAFLNISNSVFENNYEAFYIYYLDNSTIYDCQILNSSNYGLRVYDSNRIVLRECSVKDNLNHGVFLYYSHYGAILSSNITTNEVDGISLFGSDYNLIVNNTVNGNSGYGINAYVFSDYNIIYGNIITSNIGGNGYGYQSTNTWDDSVSVGNYWSDYHGPGTYSIAGPGNNSDRYPQGPPVVLSAHSDVSFLLTMAGASFTWDSFSTEPDNYRIFVDEVINKKGVWDGSA
ncbi:MAG: hypothetical protein E4H14_16560, partial [Candidatus Thorarchaeota archaeon]